MTFRGIIKDGRVELEAGAELPEGTRVEVEPSARSTRNSVKRMRGSATENAGSIYRLGERAVKAPAIPKDLASELDHYVYGTPKRAKSRGAKSSGKGRSSKTSGAIGRASRKR
jgi:hypothetical protein